MTVRSVTVILQRCCADTINVVVGENHRQNLVRKSPSWHAKSLTEHGAVRMWCRMWCPESFPNPICIQADCLRVQNRLHIFQREDRNHELEGLNHGDVMKLPTWETARLACSTENELTKIAFQPPCP
jgi:hypothetical protein